MLPNWIRQGQTIDAIERKCHLRGQIRGGDRPRRAKRLIIRSRTTRCSAGRSEEHAAPDKVSPAGRSWAAGGIRWPAATLQCGNDGL
ncbi:TPA: hypothetical protein F6V94_00930 [Serratia marcescens]|nr:hypothetical protein [Serratia marcescens]